MLNFDNVKTPRAKPLAAGDMPAILETRFEDVRGAYRGSGKRPYTERERARRHEALLLRVDTLLRDDENGLTLESREEVPRSAKSATDVAAIAARPRVYIVRHNGEHMFGSRFYHEALTRFYALGGRDEYEASSNDT